MSASSTSASPKPTSRRPASNQTIVIVGVVIVAAIALIVFIALSGQSRAEEVNYSAIPQSRGSDGAFILGDPNAPVTIIEFADFACPHCQDYHPVITRFINDFVVPGYAQFEYRTFPTSGGDLTVFAGRVQECADEQRPGAFWDGYKLFYEMASSFNYTQDIGRVLAQREGLNYSDLLACVTRISGGQSQVQTDIAFGRSNNVSGTPAVMARIGNGRPQFITFGGVTYNRGPVPYEALAGFVRQVNPAAAAASS